MQLTYNLLLILHIVSWAFVIGAWLSRVREPRVVKGVLHAAATALVTGVLMTGIASSSDEVADVDNTKIGVKLVVALAVTTLAWLGERRGDQVKPALVHAMGLLAIANVCIAVLWN